MEKQITELDQFLTAEEIAAALGVSLRTFWRLRSTHRFPNPDLQLSRKLVRWRRATVVEWLGSNRSQSA